MRLENEHVSKMSEALVTVAAGQSYVCVPSRILYKDKPSSQFRRCVRRGLESTGVVGGRDANETCTDDGSISVKVNSKTVRLAAERFGIKNKTSQFHDGDVHKREGGVDNVQVVKNKKDNSSDRKPKWSISQPRGIDNSNGMTLRPWLLPFRDGQKTSFSYKRFSRGTTKLSCVFTFKENVERSGMYDSNRVWSKYAASCRFRNKLRAKITGSSQKGNAMEKVIYSETVVVAKSPAKTEVHLENVSLQQTVVCLPLESADASMERGVLGEFRRVRFESGCYGEDDKVKYFADSPEARLAKLSL